MTFGAASSIRIASSFGGEAAEHHRVHRADAGTGEHAEQRLRNHRHVEDHPIALADAEIGEDRGQRRHRAEEFRIGDARASCSSPASRSGWRPVRARPAATWRSTAFQQAFSDPSGNQRPYGPVSPSKARLGWVDQSIACAASSQKPSGSRTRPGMRLGITTRRRRIEGRVGGRTWRLLGRGGLCWAASRDEPIRTAGGCKVRRLEQKSRAVGTARRISVSSFVSGVVSAACRRSPAAG